MKFLLSFLLLCAVQAKTQTISSTEKIATFCKVWGFLKYYHPEVAKGNQDWDSVFRAGVQKVRGLSSQKEVNDFYSSWISSLGKVEACRNCKSPSESHAIFNMDNGWLGDSRIFSNDVIQQLKWIEANRNTGKNFYVQQNRGVGNTVYSNEKTYPDSTFPSPEMRLLTLSRYWNTIQYFFPYKYVIGKDWKEVLTEMVPEFENAKDTIAYHLLIRKLTASINDSHAGFGSLYTNRYFGFKWMPFQYKIIDNKAVVTEQMNDTLCRDNDVRIGDVFLKIDGVTIEELVKEKTPYAGASNPSTIIRNLSHFLLHGNKDSSLVSFERDGIVKEKYVKRYYYKQLNYTFSNGSRTDSFKIMDGNIGFVNLGWLMPAKVDEVMKYLKDTRAIIFDVRNYPHGTMVKISEHLNKERKEFAKFTAPDLSYPGSYYYTRTATTGRNNNNYYKGKVILLFDETSQSHAEYTLMALKTAPNVVGIGSQTAGADGNVSFLFLPGGLKTNMTGIGVYYPDGTPTQRIGIVPDIVAKPTIAGIKAGRDEVLERALIEAKK